MYEDVEALSEILSEVIGNYFTDDQTNMVELDVADVAYAVCMVLGAILSLHPSIPTTILTQLIADTILYYCEYYEENPLERPDIFKGTPQ